MVTADALALAGARIGSKRDARLLMCHIMDTDILGLTFSRNTELTDVQEKLLTEYIKRRENGEPIQYIIGSCEFMSLKFYVDKNVLIPRSDTETLVEYIIGEVKDKQMSVLDIGTGSGCIGISLAKYCPKITVDCLDISKGALKLAKKNAELNNVSDRVRLINMDILTQLPTEKYDVLVSNPPYIRPSVISELDRQVKDFEPYSALYGGDDGLLFYRRIADVADCIVKPGGVLVLEIGYDQGKSVPELFEGLFHSVQIIKDLCGNDRVVTGIKN